MNIRASKDFDFLKFLAASLVLFLHSSPLVDGKGKNEHFNLINNGQKSLGVAIFFALFRISLIYLSPIIADLLFRLVYMDGPLVKFGEYGDFYYGICVYAFPIQQFFVYFMTKSILQPLEW
jgi:hypothetical protein